MLSDQSVLIETRKIKAIAAFILADLMGVMVRGNWYRAAELKALLQNVAAKYNEAVNPHGASDNGATTSNPPWNPRPATLLISRIPNRLIGRVGPFGAPKKI